MMGWKGLLVTMAAFGLLGCSQVMPSKTTEMPLQISSQIPAAEGKVETRKLDNGQTKLEIKVEHLARPSEAVQGARTYVAWLRPSNDRSKTVKLGTLNVGDNRKAKLDTTVGYDEFDVFITAEPNNEVTEPSGQQMMTASVGRLM